MIFLRSDSLYDNLLYQRLVGVSNREIAFASFVRANACANAIADASAYANAIADASACANAIANASASANANASANASAKPCFSVFVLCFWNREIEIEIEIEI